ncbi:hypothetical protein [Streptomyces sp. NPDC049590]|uniref:hypothetical protein n=1 Tax=Streptomyces sp. NPDC049590 TaxID=3154834 RepID=UPI003430FA5A
MAMMFSAMRAVMVLGCMVVPLERAFRIRSRGRERGSAGSGFGIASAFPVCSGSHNPEQGDSLHGLLPAHAHAVKGLIEVYAAHSKPARNLLTLTPACVQTKCFVTQHSGILIGWNQHTGEEPMKDTLTGHCPLSLTLLSDGLFLEDSSLPCLMLGELLSFLRRNDSLIDFELPGALLSLNLSAFVREACPSLGLYPLYHSVKTSETDTAVSGIKEPVIPAAQWNVIGRAL